MTETVIFVPSYDDYADVWPIAADLFERFWPDRPWPIYWMTNGHPIPKIAQAVLAPAMHRDQWGNNIANVLRQICADRILFWVEEQLLLSKVPNDLLLEASNILDTNPDIGIIGLTRYYSQSGFAANQKRLGNFGYCDYNISFANALPALFRKEVLIHLLRSHSKSNEFEQESHKVMFRDLPFVKALTPVAPTFRFCDNAMINGLWRRCAVKHLEEFKFDVDVYRRGIHPDECRFMDGTPA